MKVLIVENTNANNAILVNLLNNNNIKNIVVDIVAAVKIVKTEQFNDIGLVLLSANLPNKDAVGICKEIKNNTETSEIPILFISNNTVLYAEAYSAGATDYIIQPFSNLDLLTRIKFHLKKYTLITELKKANSHVGTYFIEKSADSSKADNTMELVAKNTPQLPKNEGRHEKRVEKKKRELKNNGHELQLIFDSSPVIMILVNTKSEIIQINNAALLFTGICINEIIGKRFGDAFSCINAIGSGHKCGFTKQCGGCNQNNFLYDTIRNKTAHSKVESIFSFKHKNKLREHTVILSTSVASVNPEITVLLTMEDITKQKQTQIALYESEDRYRKLFETQNESIILINSKTKRITDVNPAACKLYGYTKQELLTLSVFDISIQHNETNETLNKTVSENNNTLVANRLHKCKNGEIIIVEVQNTIIIVDGKRTICSTHRNITKQVKAREALEKSEQTFRTLVENIEDIFWIFDVRLKKLTYVSPQSEKILGRNSEGILTDYTQIIKNSHPADAAKLKAAVSETLMGKPNTVEYRTVMASKTIKWMKLRSFGQFNVENEHPQIVGLVTDITERKLTERRVLNAILETENREREAFAKELHDGLGANLSSIKMYLERLNSDDMLESKRPLYQQKALELITMAASTSKEISYGLKPHTLVNLGLISSIELLCQNVNDLNKFNLTFYHFCENPNLNDETELAIYRILSELSNNSLKYSEAKDGHIELNINSEGTSLAYTDNGIGFDVETAKLNAGSGLKNIIARVEALGGKINIESEAKNGMRIKMYMPNQK